jgi:hypothetical protein
MIKFAENYANYSHGFSDLEEFEKTVHSEIASLKEAPFDTISLVLNFVIKISPACQPKVISFLRSFQSSKPFGIPGNHNNICAINDRFILKCPDFLSR